MKSKSIISSLVFISCMLFTCLASADMLCIGDSMMSNNQQYIRQLYPDADIDAQKGRTLSQGIEIAKELKKQNRLTDNILISFGTDETLNKNDIKQMLDIIGSNHTILWINSYCPENEWQDANNKELTKFMFSYPNVFVVNWYATALAHNEYLKPETHKPNTKGQKVYAALIKASIDEANNTEDDIIYLDPEDEEFF